MLALQRHLPATRRPDGADGTQCVIEAGHQAVEGLPNGIEIHPFMWLTRCGRRHCAVSALAGKEDGTPEDSNRLLSFVWAATQMKHANTPGSRP
jgi:hypothetical protein